MKKKFTRILASAAALLLVSAPAWADLNPGTGLGVYQVEIEDMVSAGKTYSGGMDVVYAQVASGLEAAKTRSFLKCEDGKWDGTNKSVQVNMYSYLGKHLETFADVNPYTTIYCQSVKVNPVELANDDREIWFSVTGGTSSEGAWYSVTVDSDFTTVTSGPTQEFTQPGNWEVEWSTDSQLNNTPFFAGKATNAWTDPHAIYIHTSNGLQKVVDVGGFSCGFAFDNNGNLYTGTYTDSGPANQQYVRLYSKQQIRNAISTKVALLATDAISTIDIPAVGTGNDIYLGANDLESDPDGNIYVSANGSWNAQYDSDLGFVFKIDACTNIQTPPTTMTQIAAGTMDADEPDWQKSLAYDGASNLIAGGHHDPTNTSMTGNRLYVDQDFRWGTGGPDNIAGLGNNTNSDNDTIIDCFDNAYLTDNEKQVDADLDMYGNYVDGDFNNDGIVNMVDFGLFQPTVGTSNPEMDMNSDGIVNMLDFNMFSNLAGDTAPYY